MFKTVNVSIFYITKIGSLPISVFGAFMHAIACKMGSFLIPLARRNK